MQKEDERWGRQIREGDMRLTNPPLFFGFELFDDFLGRCILESRICIGVRDRTVFLVERATGLLSSILKEE